VLDGDGGSVEIRLPLGIATQPRTRCRFEAWRSPVVLIPDEARSVVLYRDSLEVDRVAVNPSVEAPVRVGFDAR
jgi:hypothetical protein